MAPKKHSTSKRKNRSSDVNSTLEDTSSVECTGTSKQNKKQRSESFHGQQTLTAFVSGVEKMTTRDGNKTYTADSGGGTSSILEQLSSIENGLSEKFQTLKDKVEASESRLCEHISEQFDRLRGDIFALQQENDNLRAKLEDTDDVVEELQDNIKTLRNTIQREREKINDLEQYQRRDSVRFLGVGPDNGEESLADCEKKVLNIINNSLHLDHISAGDISIAHRVGPKTGNRPRPIIVKFLSRKVKTEVIQKRRLLKGSHKGIVEDLTPLNMKRLLEVKNHSNVKNCWTKDGTIYAQLKNNKIIKIVQGDLSVLGESCANITAPDMEIAQAHTGSEGRISSRPSRPMASTPKQNLCPQSTTRHHGPRDSRNALSATSTTRDRENRLRRGETARCQSPSPSQSRRRHVHQETGDNDQDSLKNQQQTSQAVSTHL